MTDLDLFAFGCIVMALVGAAFVTASLRGS